MWVQSRRQGFDKGRRAQHQWRACFTSLNGAHHPRPFTHAQLQRRYGHGLDGSPGGGGGGDGNGNGNGA